MAEQPATIMECLETYRTLDKWNKAQIGINAHEEKIVVEKRAALTAVLKRITAIMSVEPELEEPDAEPS